MWRGVNSSSLKERPFHIYSSEFYEVIGSDPSLTLIATSESDPIFHEAVTWYVSPNLGVSDFALTREGTQQLMKCSSFKMLETRTRAPA